MSAQNIDYGAMLADLEAKKAVIESAIASVRAAMAAGALGVSVGDGITVSDSVSLSVSRPFDGDIPSGMFFGKKSIPEAAKLYLSMVKRKQTTKEITSALEEGGMTTTADNFEATVTAGLFRASKKFGEIVKVKGSWGLAEWYKGMRVGPQENKAPAKKRKKAKKRKAKARTEPDSTRIQAESDTPPSKARPQGTIEAYFNAHLGEELSLLDLMRALDMRTQTIALICSKLAHNGKLEKLPSGRFRKPRTLHTMPKAS